VKVSLSNQAVYVVEGERGLLAAATCVGTPSHPTPKGDFRIFNKIARKRSGSYGYYVKDGTIEPAQAGKGTGKYVGYPMAWWCEFHPAYGFHHGWVWPEPRTHGCLRLHETVAPKFYHLVKEGTPVNVAETQSLDQTAGKNLPRPQDYRNDDPAPEIMISDKAFKPLPEPLFVD
jgi:lipoprotein-anchoring transpeptidase ErfK/SrfK